MEKEDLDVASIVAHVNKKKKEREGERERERECVKGSVGVRVLPALGGWRCRGISGGRLSDFYERFFFFFFFGLGLL